MGQKEIYLELGRIVGKTCRKKERKHDICRLNSNFKTHSLTSVMVELIDSQSLDPLILGPNSTRMFVFVFVPSSCCKWGLV